MSWLSSGLKAVGKGIQKVANTKVAGVSLGGMLGPGGQLIRGGNIKQNFIDDFKGGLNNAKYVVPAVGGLKAIGAPGFADTVSGGPPDLMDGEGGPFADGGAEGGGENGFLKFLKEHGGDIARIGGAVYGGTQAIKNTNEANALNKDALAKLNAPLNAPDLNYLFADPQNPFKKGRIPVVGGKQ